MNSKHAQRVLSTHTTETTNVQHSLQHTVQARPLLDGAVSITLLLIVLFGTLPAQSQPIITQWIFNKNGAKASYWENTAMGMNAAPRFVFQTSPDSADVLKVCYDNTYVWVRCHGLTENMGQYLNPGKCLAQNYTFRLPRNPTAPPTKTISPKTGPIGVLLNGVPIYGLSNAASWNGTSNVMMGGRGVWNVEVYRSEGAVLDTAFGAHPQQQGAYHTHATPLRLYRNTPTQQHSPLIGFAFDGFPVYGPYGYSNPMNPNSTVTRMKSGYSLRNITVRTSLPGGGTLAPDLQGPPVSTQYPLGTYCEDYEWLASNGGDLDRYNGRFCVTPEYPSGTYAYFTTINAAGVPAFPYIIGIEYYGAPDTQNFPMMGMVGGGSATIPSTVTNCIVSSPVATSVRVIQNSTTSGIPAPHALSIFPQPANDEVFVAVHKSIIADGAVIEVVNTLGHVIYSSRYEMPVTTTAEETQILRIELRQAPGLYAVRVLNSRTGERAIGKLVMQ